MVTQNPVAIELSQPERAQLRRLANSPSQERRLVRRARMMLDAADGNNGCESARRQGVRGQTVRKWRQRYLTRRGQEADSTVTERLGDAGRVGRPPTFDAFFWVDLMAIATSDPNESGPAISEWTHPELADEVVQRGLADSIHPATVGGCLAPCELNPPRVQGRMNRREDAEFDHRAHDVKESLVRASSDEGAAEEVVVCFDEKTGMQAKAGIAPDIPMRPGQPKRLEFEDERHGTLVLLAMMVVNRGLTMGRTRSNRPNEITAAVLREFFKERLAAGTKPIHEILDQLNPPWSEPLVEVLPMPSPDQIKTGAQRRLWLSDPDKAIGFHFTPQHASWLNPIEIWLSVLLPKLLRHGSLSSTKDLPTHVRQFIDYYHTKLAHPYRFKRWALAA